VQDTFIPKHDFNAAAAMGGKRSCLQRSGFKVDLVG
jgi:hypothetical protein